MKINKLTPQGFCGGVKNALNKLDKAINSNTKKPVYLLGSIIHNHHIVDYYKSKGVILLENNNKSRLELLDEIDYGTIVFSAHGVSPKVYNKAINKGLDIIDTTCPNVEIIHNQIKTHLNDGYTCIYIGNKKHPECEGVLGIDNSIILISSINDIKNLNIDNKNIYITNQTTLSLYELDSIYKELLEIYPNAKVDNKICMATTLRQKAILNQDKPDLAIIVGDSASSNTKKLYETTINKGYNAILIENIDGIKNFDFTNINEVSITSGASTPDYLVDEIIEYLKKLEKA